MINLTELERLENAAIWLSSQKGNADLHGTLEYIDIYDTKEAVLLLRDAFPALIICAQALESIKEAIEEIPHKHPQMQAIGQVCKAALAKLGGV